METIAVYRETRIKIYGFEWSADACRIEVEFEAAFAAELGRRWANRASEGTAYRLVLIQPSGSNRVVVNLFVNDGEREALIRNLEEDALDYQLMIRAQSPVDILHFQGPHFGERYGIVSSALDALSSRGIRTLAVGCSGSSVYIALPGDTRPLVMEALAEPFIIPQAPSRRKKTP